MSDKKRFFPVIVLITILLLLPMAASAGGAAGEDGGTEKTKVTMWHMPWSDTFEEYMIGVAEVFEAENPGIDVETIMIPWSGREAKFMAAMAAEDTPDVTMIGADEAAKFEDAGGLRALDEFNLDYSEIQERIVEDTKFKGKIWGMPIAIETTGIIYNADLLEEAGLGTDFDELPSTWEEYTEMAIKLTVDKDGDGTPDQYGSNWRPMGSVWSMFVPYLQAAGGEVFSEDGKKITFNSAAGLETLTWFVDMHNKLKVMPPGVPSSHDNMNELFLAGKTASFIHADGDFIAALAKNHPNFNVVTGPALKNKERVTQGWIGIASLFEASKNKEAAVRWIQFLARDDVNQGILEECGYVSVKTTITNEATAALSPALATAMEQTRLYGRPPAGHWVARDVNGPFRPKIEAAYLGQITPEQALNDAAAEIQAWLNERD